MRFHAILVPLCLTLSVWSQLTYTVPVADKSGSGSPLAISGTASFTERFTAQSVDSSGIFRVKARNVSGKSIILMLAGFDAAGPHGGGTHHAIKIDHFFWGDIAPGESFVLARGRSRKQTSTLRRDSLEPAAEPKAEIRIQYVQFEDGSIFGDDAAAKGAIDLRPIILEALRRLDKAGNTEEFLALLKQNIRPEDADRFLATFRETQKKYGTDAARAQVRRGLIVAEGRVPALRAVQMVRK
jgi:hypothetical protein